MSLGVRLSLFGRLYGLLCDLLPSGRYAAIDLHRAGGIPHVMKMLLAQGLIRGDTLTISAETTAETLKDVSDEPPGDQAAIRTWNHPVRSDGHLVILRGNLAPNGAVAKLSGVARSAFTGPARMFESEEGALAAILGDGVRVEIWVGMAVWRWRIVPVPSVHGQGSDIPFRQGAPMDAVRTIH